MKIFYEEINLFSYQYIKYKLKLIKNKILLINLVYMIF